MLDDALNGHLTDNYQFVLMTKDKRPVYILFNATPRYDAAGNVVGVIGIGQDVMDTIAKEAAEQANQAKREFLAYIFHEVRQPLQGFSINLKTLKRSFGTPANAMLPASTSRAEFSDIEILIADMGDSCDAMSTILNDVLDLQKMGEGLRPPQYSPGRRPPAPPSGAAAEFSAGAASPQLYLAPSSPRAAPSNWTDPQAHHTCTDCDPALRDALRAHLGTQDRCPGAPIGSSRRVSLLLRAAVASGATIELAVAALGSHKDGQGGRVYDTAFDLFESWLRSQSSELCLAPFVLQLRRLSST